MKSAIGDPGPPAIGMLVHCPRNNKISDTRPVILWTPLPFSTDHARKPFRRRCVLCQGDKACSAAKLAPDFWASVSSHSIGFIS